MTLNLFDEKGTPLDKQRFTWREMVQAPYSKLDDDAFTRVRTILMNGIEAEALRFQHACARMNGDLQQALAMVRRVEQHQQTLVNWLNPADQNPLETTIGFEQVAIEVTASVARNEPDPYLKQVYRFGLLEDFDHMYRYSALYDRVMGRDSAYLLQGYTDVLPGRPTSVEHRHPLDDLREPYAKETAAPITKLHAMTIMAAEHMTHDFYMTVGPMFSDPVARQLYAEIASIEEQHVTQYESIVDPTESWLEKWLLHEACEVFNYYGCVQSEKNPRIKALWERMLDYELGHLHFVAHLFEKHERRDAREILPETLPEPIAFSSHRDYVREVLRTEVDLRADGKRFVPAAEEPKRSIEVRETLNRDGSPSDLVAASWVWQAGTELAGRGNGAATREPGRPSETAKAMEHTIALGQNHTTRFPRAAMYEAMAEGTSEFPPSSSGDGRQLIAGERIRYSEAGDPIGHVPPPIARGVDAETLQLSDKLGERLAFERTGTRLYDALLSKHDAFGSFDGGPERKDLEVIRQQEHEHFRLLEGVIRGLGGDAAALTPSADLAAVLSEGLQQALTDPRVDLRQSLEAILVAELTDHASWETLIELAQQAGHDELVEPFARALEHELEHVEKVRSWIEAGHGWA